MHGMIYRAASYVYRNTLLKVYRDYKERRHNEFWKEHRECHGRLNPDKTFFIVRRTNTYSGLLSLMMTHLMRIDEAVKRGCIPVVDMQNNFNVYLSEDRIGKENAWEYYFEQPMGYNLQDIRKSKNILYGSGDVPEAFPYNDVRFASGESGELQYWRELAHKYIRLNHKTEQYVQNLEKQLFAPGDRVVGVKCRGTDYLRAKPEGHPRQPSVEQIIHKTEEVMQEHECNKIFLATEDEKMYDAFAEYFKDMVVTNKQEYVHYEKGPIGQVVYREDTKERYMEGLEYLSQIVILSRCNCFVAGLTSGTIGAMFLTKGYEYSYIFDLGLYSREEYNGFR